jgi:REP element-mobilizing transposase RayT
MPRLPRISPAGIAIHIIQRGNNRQSCFVSDEDHWAYINLLRQTAKDNHARPTIKIYSFQYVTIILGMIFYCRLPYRIF